MAVTIKTIAEELGVSYATVSRALNDHPDVNDAEDAEQKFKDVQEAYEVLSDESKRKAYDHLN